MINKISFIILISLFNMHGSPRDPFAYGSLNSHKYLCKAIGIIHSSKEQAFAVVSIDGEIFKVRPLEEVKGHKVMAIEPNYVKLQDEDKNIIEIPFK